MAGTGLFLADREFMDDIAVVIRDIDYAQGKKVGGAEHGVDRRVEQGKIPDFVLCGEQGTDQGTLFGCERRHLANGFVLVPRAVLNFGFFLPIHKSKNSIVSNECKALFHNGSLLWLLSKAKIENINVDLQHDPVPLAELVAAQMIRQSAAISGRIRSLQIA